jgi:hypothetical protein
MESFDFGYFLIPSLYRWATAAPQWIWDGNLSEILSYKLVRKVSAEMELHEIDPRADEKPLAWHKNLRKASNKSRPYPGKRDNIV